MKVVWTLPAKYRLKEIFYYYKHHASLQVAKKITANLFNATRALSTHLKIGNREELLIHKKDEYRYLIERNYKIIYRTAKRSEYMGTNKEHTNKRINTATVFIIDVFDCRQNPKKLLRNK